MRRISITIGRSARIYTDNNGQACIALPDTGIYHRLFSPVRPEEEVTIILSGRPALFKSDYASLPKALGGYVGLKYHILREIKK